MAAEELGYWWRYALCAEPQRAFYSEPKSKEEEKKSKSVCKVCPVRLECLAHAFCTNTETGFFGGMNFGKIDRSFMIAIFNLPIRAGESAVVVELQKNIDD
jgi:hypothetical protein